jgi:hypothetical protein
MGKRGRRGREESSVAFHLLIDIAVAIDVASLVLPSLTFQSPLTQTTPLRMKVSFCRSHHLRRDVSVI